MPLAFHTPSDCGSTTEIANVGELGAGGTSPIALTRAAEVMPELQAEGKPLAGAALKAAAKAWAEERGLEVSNVTIVPAEEQDAHPFGDHQFPAPQAPEDAQLGGSGDEAANAATDSGAADTHKHKE